MMLWSSCVWYVDGRMAGGGGGLLTNIHMRKKGKD